MTLLSTFETRILVSIQFVELLAVPVIETKWWSPPVHGHSLCTFRCIGQMINSVVELGNRWGTTESVSVQRRATYPGYLPGSGVLLEDFLNFCDLDAFQFSVKYSCVREVYQQANTQAEGSRGSARRELQAR